VWNRSLTILINSGVTLKYQYTSEIWT